MSLNYKNKKTVICEYYMKNICKFMKTPKLCSYVHGDNCYNNNCIFYHNRCDIVCNKNMKIKRKKSLCKNMVKEILPVTYNVQRVIYQYS